MKKRGVGAGSDPTPERFEAVVLGSGFGGSVMAYRLAAAGKSVCLLERGKPYAPGSFARTPHEIRNNFWRPSRAHYGLVDVWSFGGMEACVSAGLGGGSLIYANVLIRKDERWFVHDGGPGDGYEDWPLTRGQLDRHYDAVEAMLKPEIYPEEYQRDNKTAAMRQAARDLRISETTYDKVDSRKPQFYLPQLAVTFRNRAGVPAIGEPIVEEPNLHGKQRETCRLCGECDVGCNYGAKNTLDFNYLTQAQRHGAAVRTLCEAESIQPVRWNGRPAYRVEYSVHDLEAPGQKKPAAVVAERVIVACGTFGSTLLLMRSGNRLRGLSPMLGRRFCGNGDYLAFAYDCKQRVAAGRTAPRSLNASRAPVITCTFRFPDARDNGGAGRGGYLQDAGYPLAGDYVWELTAPEAVAARIAHFAFERLSAWFFGSTQREVAGQLERLLGSADISLASMPLLGIGRDVPNGRMRLNRKRRLDLAWSDGPSKPWFDEIGRIAADVAQKLGGRTIRDPLTSLFNSQITVHPLGGCSMGRDRERGVVDSFGRVFGWPGLYVADGAVMPGPVGANPSFTIAALSNRFAERMLDDWEASSCAR